MSIALEPSRCCPGEHDGGIVYTTTQRDYELCKALHRWLDVVRISRRGLDEHWRRRAVEHLADAEAENVAGMATWYRRPADVPEGWREDRR